MVYKAKFSSLSVLHCPMVRFVLTTIVHCLFLAAAHSNINEQKRMIWLSRDQAMINKLLFNY